MKLQKKSLKKETFALDSQDLSVIRNEINRIYNMDVESIRNLGAISKSLLTGTNTFTSSTTGTPGDLTIPANKTIFQGSTKVTGNSEVTGNSNITGDSEITGNNRITGNLFVHGKQLIPLGIIMAWYQPTAPPGWGLCDGTIYNSGSLLSPDLRGRFIKMATAGLNFDDDNNHLYNVADTANLDINTVQRGNADGYIRRLAFGLKGGSDFRVQTIEEMPRHDHGFKESWHIWRSNFLTNYGGGVSQDPGQFVHRNPPLYDYNAGGGLGFGVLSPYYSLVYIIYIG